MSHWSDMLKTTHAVETALAGAMQAWRETRITGSTDTMKEVKDSTMGILGEIRKTMVVVREQAKRQQAAVQDLITAASVVVVTQDSLDTRDVPIDQLESMLNAKAALKVAIERACEACANKGGLLAQNK